MLGYCPTRKCCVGVLPNANPQREGFRVAVEYRLKCEELKHSQKTKKREYIIIACHLLATCSCLPQHWSRTKVDRISIPNLPLGDGRINIVKSGDDVATGRAGGAVLISISLFVRPLSFRKQKIHQLLPWPPHAMHLG